MISFDKDGWAVSSPIKVERFPNLKTGAMPIIHGIIMHQTGAATSASTLNSYKQPQSNGAHFLIEKSGTIIQTASTLWKLKHVGPLNRAALPNIAARRSRLRSSRIKVHAMAMHELAKPVPDRYPANRNANGIEIVRASDAKALPGVDAPYEPLTTAQQTSMKWLVAELRQNFGVPLN